MGTTDDKGLFKTKKETSKNDYIICDQCGNNITLKKGKQRRTFRNTKLGKRKDLGNIFFRSGWEANIARYLNLLIKKGRVKRWTYEPKRFYFPIKVGTISYLPDFLVVLPNGDVEWWEVKGYWTSRGRTSVKRFRKYYPDEVLKIIDKVAYKIIEIDFSDKIPKWEF